LSRMGSTDTSAIDNRFFSSVAPPPSSSGELAESSSRVRAEREPVSLLPAMRERDNSPAPSVPAPIWHRRPMLVYGGAGALAMLILLLWFGARGHQAPPSAATLASAPANAAVAPPPVAPIAAAPAP